jgi:type II secretory pathway pseudopilin PulG
MGAGLASQGIKNGNVTQSTLGGAISGAALGATIGSIIPGIGTVIGGVVGFVAGAAMGFISGRRKKRKRKAQKRAAAAAAAAQAAYENDLARELIKEDVIGKYGGGNALEGEVDTISGLMSGDVSDEELAKLGGAQQIIANAQGIKSQSGINATNNRTVNVGAPVINVSVGSIGDNYETAQLAQDLGYHLVNTINAAGAGV